MQHSRFLVSLTLYVHILIIAFVTFYSVDEAATIDVFTPIAV